MGVSLAGDDGFSMTKSQRQLYCGEQPNQLFFFAEKNVHSSVFLLLLIIITAKVLEVSSYKQR